MSPEANSADMAAGGHCFQRLGLEVSWCVGGAEQIEKINSVKTRTRNNIICQSTRCLYYFPHLRPFDKS